MFSTQRQAEPLHRELERLGPVREGARYSRKNLDFRVRSGLKSAAVSSSTKQDEVYPPYRAAINEIGAPGGLSGLNVQLWLRS